MLKIIKKNGKSKNSLLLFFIFIFVENFFFINSTSAYPIYAQQAYSNPREANGRIVCANCHLAQKPVEIEVSQSVFPDQVFEANVNIPYDTTKNQILGDGKKGGLNIGAVLILPDGFKLAPKNRLSEELKQKLKSAYITPYNANQENILVVGPISGTRTQEITFPILSPDPAKDKKVNFLKYPIYVGANRGRGQLYPTGEKSNNNTYLATSNGKITDIQITEKGLTKLIIQNVNGTINEQLIPKGLDLVVNTNSIINIDQPLTVNPNVGGFGQTEAEIVLQDPSRILGYVVFSFITMLTQVFLVIKKKQFEKVQISEMNF